MPSVFSLSTFLALDSTHCTPELNLHLTRCQRTFRRQAFSILERGEAVATGKVVSSLLRNITINLVGLGATIVGLQVRLHLGFFEIYGRSPAALLAHNSICQGVGLLGM